MRQMGKKRRMSEEPWLHVRELSPKLWSLQRYELRLTLPSVTVNCCMKALGLNNFVRGRGLMTGIGKALQNTPSSVDQNTIYWILIKLQNVIRNQIDFNTS